MNKRIIAVILCTVISIPLIGVICAVIGTYGRMGEFERRFTPGTPLSSLTAFAGDPAQIIHKGERLNHATRSYKLRFVDDHTAVYVYPYEGVPYFNVFAYIDLRTQTITQTDIENLWW